MPSGKWMNVEPASGPRGYRRLWAILAIVVVALLAGGYIAYSKGYLPLPFLTPNSTEILSKLAGSLNDVKTAQYRLGIRALAEARQSGATSLFVNAPANTNSAASFKGAASLPLNLFGTDSPKSFFASIPNDMDLSGAITVYFESDKKPADANGLLRLEGTYKGGDLQVAADIELRKVEKTLYGIVNKFPSLPFYDLSKLKGTWVALSPQDNRAAFLNNWYEDTNQTQNVEEVKTALRVAIEQKFLSVDTKLAAETITGVRSDHYRLKLDTAALKNVYEELRRIHKEKGKPTEAEEQALKDLENEKFRLTMDRFAQNSTFEIWIDKVRGVVRQAKWRIVIVPPDDTANFKDKQLAVELTATLDKINERVAVTAPSDTIDLYEAEARLSGAGEDEIAFERQLDQVRRVRTALKNYRDIKGSFPESLGALNAALPSLADECTQQNSNTNSVVFGTPEYTKSIACSSAKSMTDGARITDVSTKKEYPFTRANENYELRYQLKFYDGMPEYLKSEYVDGENIATADQLSRSAKSPLSDALNPPSTTLNLNSSNVNAKSPAANTNTNRSVNSAANTNLPAAPANTNTFTAPQQVTFTPISSTFSYAAATFRFSINDPAGVGGMTVRGFGQDWDPFDDIYGLTDAKLISGTAKNGTWELTAVKITDAGLNSVVPERGWYVVWRRTNPTDGITFYHGGLGGAIYKTYEEVQRHPLSFNTISKLAPKDTDNDGLADEAEPLYGADMNQADTDGDGYADGVEVQNGFNPNGPGALTPPA